MSFAEFLGNERIARALQGMLRRERVPSALLFTGPRGIGKLTLARMFAQAANCERLTDDFCGECAACVRIARLGDPKPLIDAALTERGEGADAATIERTPLILEGNRDVWLIVPDPVRLRAPVVRPMVRVGQVRAVQRAAFFHPEGRRRIFILDGADTLRWADADLLLKILEEPPDTATLILLSPAPGLLPQTIRSRCLQFHFAPVPLAQIEAFLKERTEVKPAERTLAAQLSEGSPGVALAIDLKESARLRKSALTLLEKGAAGSNYAEIFAATAQLAKQERESFENILAVFYSLLTDVLEICESRESSLLRNPDLRRELESLAKKVSGAWVLRATQSLDHLESGLRRNIGRQLGLDAVVVSLAQASP